MKLFIQEYATGGGLLGSNLDASLLVEGFGMLRSLVNNYTQLGYEVYTTLDKRLDFLSGYLSTRNIEVISKANEFKIRSLEVVNQCDSFLVIAPGTDEILEKIVRNYETTGKKSMNCQTKAIRYTTDKSQIYEYCYANNIQYPRTIVFNRSETSFEIGGKCDIKASRLSDIIKEFELILPVVVKPNEGVACEGLSVIRSKDELNEFETMDSDASYLVQEFIYGESISVTAFVWNSQVTILSINEQVLHLTHEKSVYLGGISNIKPQQSSEILQFTTSFLKGLSGLRGFIGIDMIAHEKIHDIKELFLIEVNPRVTTPICGLMNPNNDPFEPINQKDYDPKKFDVTFFAKMKFDFPLEMNNPLYIDLITEPEVITPPLCFDKKSVYTLIKGSGKSKQKAKNGFNLIVTQLLNKLKKAFLSK